MHGIPGDFDAIAVVCLGRPVLLELFFGGTNAEDKPVVKVGKGITFIKSGLSSKQVAVQSARITIAILIVRYPTI